MLTPFQNRAKRALSSHALFGALSEECLSWLRRTPVRMGEVLFDKGESSDTLFGLVGGRLKLCTSAPTASTSGDGARQVAFRIVGPGEMIGELGFSNRSPRHATAVALAHCECATLDRRDLEPLLERQPLLREVLAGACSESAQRLSKRIEDAAFLSVEERVEKALLDCARRFGVRTEGGGLCVELRQQDLADVLGLSRASVNKVLTSPAMLGRVELGRGRIVLLGA